MVRILMLFVYLNLKITFETYYWQAAISISCFMVSYRAWGYLQSQECNTRAKNLRETILKVTLIRRRITSFKKTMFKFFIYYSRRLDSQQINYRIYLKLFNKTFFGFYQRVKKKSIFFKFLIFIQSSFSNGGTYNLKRALLKI